MITDYPYIPESLDSITPISADLCGFRRVWVARYSAPFRRILLSRAQIRMSEIRQTLKAVTGMMSA